MCHLNPRRCQHFSSLSFSNQIFKAHSKHSVGRIVEFFLQNLSRPIWINYAMDGDGEIHKNIHIPTVLKNMIMDTKKKWVKCVTFSRNEILVL